MHIDYFREHQNDVFVPALGFVLITAIVIALPILFGPTLARRGRRRPVLTLSVVVAGLAIIGAVAAALPGFATLTAERQTLQNDLRDRYGIEVPAGDASRLLNGDEFRLAATHLQQKVHLRSIGAGDYILVRAPTTNGSALELPRV